MKPLDLRKDFTNISRFISSAYGPSTPQPMTVQAVETGHHELISATSATRRAGWPWSSTPALTPGLDGSWNSHITGNCLERPKWLAVVEANEDAPGAGGDA